VAGEPILVVDDNPVNVKLLRMLLGDAGYDVREADGADQAMAVLQAFRPRLILMDVQLPGVDGLELTRRLKADPDTRDTIIVGVTACAARGDAERVLAAGCDGYVAKPIDIHELLATVARHLRP
jgi:CheY-like chemotaxis protein